MGYVEMLLQTYDMIVFVAGIGVLALILFVGCIGIFAVNRRIKRLQRGMENYLKVILAEEESETEQEEDEARTASTQEQQMRQSIQKKRMEQQEAVLDAVLQEMFP
ncbi:MAG: hypothetical protein MR355_01295 [Lachnospiraceae bacterium]|nr:hypothetical protein [Lachnospiraceae bacterium]